MQYILIYIIHEYFFLETLFCVKHSFIQFTTEGSLSNMGIALHKKKTSHSTLMTEGSIWKHILFFSIPLILGNMLQQLYNTADPLIVGNFLGSNALAAVSSSGNLIFLLSVLSTESPWVPGLLSPGIMEQKRKTVCKSRYIQQWPLETWPGLY